MSEAPYPPFAASHRSAPPGTRLRAVDPAETIEVSIYLRPTGAEHPKGISRASLATARMAAHRDDFAQIEQFATAHGLTVTATEPARRLIKLSGTARHMQAAFHCELGLYEHEGKRFRGRSGALHLPRALHGIVQAVLGLDTRPQAHPHFRAAAALATGYAPNEVAQFYGFPAGATGAGECIGLIELGGGYLDSDTAAAFAAMGLATPNVQAIGVDGATNAPTPDDGANGEVALDIQVAGGAAPGAAIAVYFTPNTDAGFADAISQAVHDAANAPSVLSISWGAPEPNWTGQAIAALNSALQDADTLDVSVFVAAGDSLATDGLNDGAVHVDFPASSPWAAGCGGTVISTGGGAIVAEAVWNDGSSGTGGGISALTPVPSFQAGISLPPNASGGGPGRGVPDVAGNAAPGSGYRIAVNGQRAVVGGTSAVAPLWAGLAALINQLAGRKIGFVLPALYAGAACREITVGTNMPQGSALGYPAGPGWNACTGLGVPDGGKVAALFLPPQPAA